MRFGWSGLQDNSVLVNHLREHEAELAIKNQGHSLKDLVSGRGFFGVHADFVGPGNHYFSLDSCSVLHKRGSAFFFVRRTFFKFIRAAWLATFA